VCVSAAAPLAMLSDDDASAPDGEERDECDPAEAAHDARRSASDEASEDNSQGASDEDSCDDSAPSGGCGEQRPADDGSLGTRSCLSERYGPQAVVDETFECLDLRAEAAQELQRCWAKFLAASGTKEAASDAIYAAWFEASPCLQSFFKTPRAVMAMRIMTGLQQIMQALADPAGLKVIVETLGFLHFQIEVTPPRAAIFRDAFCELMSMELGSQYTSLADEALRVTLNYVGGAYCFLRTNFAGRLKILSKSWAAANGKKLNAAGEEMSTVELAAEAPAAAKDKPKVDDAQIKVDIEGQEKGAAKRRARDNAKIAVPTTFHDMFRFNAAVMGLGSRFWFAEVLHSFDAIVRNVSNTTRLNEECDVLSLRLAKCHCDIRLSEYRSVMLSSLRSLIAKDWDEEHESAWDWLWSTTERLLTAILRKLPEQEKALAKLWGGLDDKSFARMRTQVYAIFFGVNPEGMDYFRQSTTRLHFIADKVITITLDMYKEPATMVNDLSALGLRHVGYGIPTELFAPFASAFVQVVKEFTGDRRAIEAFRWSMDLVSRILVRVITEGSTVVMRAINENSGKLLRRAIGCAPRSKRADWLLKVAVGTQSISPLEWAIKAGAFEAAEAILRDLLTIRADRDRYYYGADRLFERQPQIVRELGIDAPSLLPVLFDGLVWRSRLTENCQRRVIYFVKHLLIDAEGGFAQAIESVTELKDPKIVCHPVFALVTDIVWSRVAYIVFLYGKLWFLLTLVVYLLAQSVLFRVGAETGSRDTPFATRLSIFLCRCFVYGCSMSSLICSNVKRAMLDYRGGDVFLIGRLAFPAFLMDAQAACRFVLMLVLLLMFFTEPILSCLSAAGTDEDQLFSEFCMEDEKLFRVYSVLGAIGMLLYYFLLIDLTVFSTRISAFALVIGKILSEVGVFLTALAFIVFSFSTAVCALKQDFMPFKTVPEAAVFLLKIFLGMIHGEAYAELTEYPMLTGAVLLFMVTSIVFLLNLLVAQLSCSYGQTFQDLVGFARIKRGVVVVDCMRSLTNAKWQRFIDSLELDRPCVFGEGDLGFPGAICMTEPSSANPTTAETIRRFGGSTSPDAVWPEEDEEGKTSADRFETVELIVRSALKKMDRRRNVARGGGSTAGISSGMTSGMTSGTASKLDADHG